MEKVKFPLDEGNRCQLPPRCVCCGGASRLQVSEETFQSSNPLQLVCVLPWFFVAPALKTAPASFFLALFLSLGLYAALAIKVRVSIPRCKDCLVKKSAQQRNAALLFSIGLLLTFSSVLINHEAVLPLGFLLTFSAILYAGFAARRFAVRLSRLHGRDAVLLLPFDTTDG